MLPKANEPPLGMFGILASSGVMTDSPPPPDADELVLVLLRETADDEAADRLDEDPLGRDPA